MGGMTDEQRAIVEKLEGLGLVAGATIRSVQRQLGVDISTAMRLLALREGLSVLLAAPAPAGDGPLVTRLLKCADDLMPLAESVSNLGKPESDNNFGRAATVMREAARSLTASPQVQTGVSEPETGESHPIAEPVGTPPDSDDVQFWMMVADGVNHDPRCASHFMCPDPEHASECLRCEAERLRAELDALKAGTPPALVALVLEWQAAEQLPPAPLGSGTWKVNIDRMKAAHRALLAWTPAAPAPSQAVEP